MQGEGGREAGEMRQVRWWCTCLAGRGWERPSAPHGCQLGTEAHKTRKGFLKSIGSGRKGELRLGSQHPLRSSRPQREEPTGVTSSDGRHLTVHRQRRQTCPLRSLSPPLSPPRLRHHPSISRAPKPLD
ncbi:hypothetical protein Pmani_013027 [Petrolisthes manimaculis]|uniref:Uncharacterized protein n=1 Tax=Petrolisthes manimaculis TaxID=1843537 RepID=A0AAE1PYA5_9EUCA|nr:hypothetical protein Pmani_013027 [Petrolisthes manimaculis]